MIISRKSFANFRFLAYLLCLVIFVSCTKKDEKMEGSKSTSGAVDLSNTLLTRIPANSYGFVYMDTAHPAYQRFLQSPWGSSQFSFVKNSALDKALQADGIEAEDASPVVKSLKNAFMKGGIDITKEANLNNLFPQLFTQAAIFFAPGTGSSNVNPADPKSLAEADISKLPSVGAVFAINKKSDVGAIVTALKAELSAHGVKVDDEKSAQGQEFSIRLDETAGTPPAGTPAAGSAANEIPRGYVAWDKDLVVVSNSPEITANIMSGSTGKLPEIVNTPEYLEATKGFPGEKEILGTAYIDVGRVIADVANGALKTKRSQVATVNFMTANIPIRALAAASAMDDAPRGLVRITYKDTAENVKEWFSAFQGSPSATLVSALPSNPVLFFSLDGQTIRRVKDLAMKNLGPGAQPFQTQLAVLDGIKRIGFSMRSAALGQSMLPIPDIMILIDTDKADQAKEQVVQLISMGMPNAHWQDKTVDDLSVKSINTPIGVGMFLASQNDVLIASSTEIQLKNAMAALKGKNGSFSQSIAPAVKGVLSEQPSVSNVYVNFVEAGTFMENMGGLLTMFNPQQNSGAEDFLQPARIEAIKKMGIMVGSLSVGNGVIEAKSFYQSAPEAAKQG